MYLLCVERYKTITFFNLLRASVSKTMEFSLSAGIGCEWRLHCWRYSQSFLGEWCILYSWEIQNYLKSIMIFSSFFFKLCSMKKWVLIVFTFFSLQDEVFFFLSHWNAVQSLASPLYWNVLKQKLLTLPQMPTTVDWGILKICYFGFDQDPRHLLQIV